MARHMRFFHHMSPTCHQRDRHDCHDCHDPGQENFSCFSCSIHSLPMKFLFCPISLRKGHLTSRLTFPSCPSCIPHAPLCGSIGTASAASGSTTTACIWLRWLHFCVSRNVRGDAQWRCHKSSIQSCLRHSITFWNCFNTLQLLQLHCAKSFVFFCIWNVFESCKMGCLRMSPLRWRKWGNEDFVGWGLKWSWKGFTPKANIGSSIYMKIKGSNCRGQLTQIQASFESADLEDGTVNKDHL